MRPHEEDWAFDERGPRVVFPTRVGAQASGVICGGVPQADDKAAVMRLIAAAPDMARALLGIIACSHADGETICARCLKDAHAVLTKAGVIP